MTATRLAAWVFTAALAGELVHSWLALDKAMVLGQVAGTLVLAALAALCWALSLL